MNTNFILEISNIFDFLDTNSQDISVISEGIFKLKRIAKSKHEHEIIGTINDIISSTENAILTSNLKERQNIIRFQQNRIKQIMVDLANNTLIKLQQDLEKTNIEDFKIISFDGYNFVLAGSFDFCYYHEIEIALVDVKFISCPGGIITINNFRLATETEITEIEKFLYKHDKQGIVICLEDKYDEKYYIIANGIEVRWGLVYYYNRENLNPDERIADWVKK